MPTEQGEFKDKDLRGQVRKTHAARLRSSKASQGQGRNIAGDVHLDWVSV